MDESDVNSKEHDLSKNSCFEILNTNNELLGGWG
jgi:hypothetical protein